MVSGMAAGLGIAEVETVDSPVSRERRREALEPRFRGF